MFPQLKLSDTEDAFYHNVLNSNFDLPTDSWWLNYAKQHRFRHVEYTAVTVCPGCQSNRYKKIGQYIYYSTLHSLLKCSHCELCYTNVLIDRNVRRLHFETQYKSEEYFENARRDIFRQALTLISTHSSEKTSLLDIGGATGTFCELFRRAFPDARIVINDISQDACETARKRGFSTICRSIPELVDIGQFSVVSAFDVIYYEERIDIGLNVLADLVAPKGLLILRLPNKFLSIICLHYLRNFVGRSLSKRQTSIPFFNPEHLYIFSRAYIVKKLGSLGFHDVKIKPSNVLRKKKTYPISSALNGIAEYFHAASGFTIAPSMFVLATKE
jgi:2-polyprenyl-3-methyl-5-hydroxy-6-metoxy-1,4-benzoquinol methylase